jgi:adenosylcobinamide-GDP ribazoletransferase
MNAIEQVRPRLGELRAAFALLTRLPVSHLSLPAPDSASDAVWAFPIVGAVIGAIGGVCFWLLGLIGCPPLAASLFALLAMVLATGALHEDGLADCADGLAGQTPDKRLAIMRDHVVGSYGALALIFAVAIQVAAIDALLLPRLVAAGLIAIGAVSRLVPVLIMASVPSARIDGMSASAGRPGNAETAIAALIAFAIAWLALPFGYAVLVMLIAALSAFLLGSFARARLGGQTGDVLGAGVLVCAVIGLTALACLAA